MKKTIKKNTQLLGIILVILTVGGFLFAQEKATDKATVPFSNPNEPGLVKVGAQHGSITVTGYNGKEVMAEARVREKLVTEEEIERNEKAKGLRLIQVDSTGLRVMEDENVMRISVSSFKQTVDISIRVPYSTSVSISAHKGDVRVENVNGEIEVTNHEGDIDLAGISGAVVAHAYTGEIRAVFKSVSPDLPMSFTSWQGDIDITLPSNTKANLKMKSGQGEVYTDFDLQIVRNPDEGFDFDSDKLKSLKRENLRNFYYYSPANAPDVPVVVPDAEAIGDLAVSISKAKGTSWVGSFDFSFNRYIYAKINGGGPVYVFSNNEGDILLRKAK